MNFDPDHEPTKEAIALCAYLIWEQEGRPEGCAVQHWLQAETQLIAAHHHERLLQQVREPHAPAGS